MGSAHFLVGAVDYLAQRIMEAEAETEEGAAIESADDAKRIVVERCIYGVDLSTLAVELAKLSLWLHTIKKDRALNFLDHHLKCGNSLIGTRVEYVGAPRKKNRKGKRDQTGQTLLFAEKLQQHLGKVLSLRRQIEDLPSDTAEMVARKKRLMDESDLELLRFKLLADLQTANYFGVETGATDIANAVYELDNDEYWRSDKYKKLFGPAEEQKSKLSFFHWELEFPEVFFDEHGRPLDGEAAGFDAVIGNPPWDIVKPQSRWFFIQYDPGFWSLGKQEALKRIEELCEDPAIAGEWEEYQRTHKFLSGYFRDPDNYRLQYKGDINLYKLFSERAFGLVRHEGIRHEGIWGFVVPSGIYTDLGSYLLRLHLFEQSKIDYLYCFENRGKKIFPDVHASYKIVLIKARKGLTTDSFSVRFMMHDLEILDRINEEALQIRVADVSRFSPDSLSIMEFNSQRDVDITAKIYDDHPLLGEQIEGTWNVRRPLINALRRAVPEIQFRSHRLI